MTEKEEGQKIPEPEPRPQNPALTDVIHRAVVEGKGGPIDLDALMEAAGGEVAARWRAAGASQQAWHTYRQAEEAYWDTVTVRELTLYTGATLRLTETTLRKTTLTPEHREHGWSERLIELLASMCAEFRVEVETDSFANPGAGQELVRTKMEEISPTWPDVDELSVAVDLAGRALDIASHRLGLETDSSESRSQ